MSYLGYTSVTVKIREWSGDCMAVATGKDRPEIWTESTHLDRVIHGLLIKVLAEANGRF